MLTKGSLRISTDSVYFRDVEPNTDDTAEINVMNVGRSTINVRFSVPLNSQFKLKTETKHWQTSICFESLFLIPMGIYPRVELLCHMVILCLVF